jgi:parallel beta-helix repeat protein
VQPWQREQLTECSSSQGIIIRNAGNFVIVNNTILYTSQTAIDYEGSSGTIQGNKIRYAGTENRDEQKGISVGGGDNTVDGNILQFVLAGIEQASGDRNVYTNNVVDQASTAGIIITGGSGILVSENTISDCQGDAIAITGGQVVVRDNVLTTNKNDLCHEVDLDADVNGQNAETTSTDCIFYPYVCSNYWCR